MKRSHPKTNGHAYMEAKKLEQAKKALAAIQEAQTELNSAVQTFAVALKGATQKASVATAALSNILNGITPAFEKPIIIE